MILLLALRNILRNKKNSLIIILLVAVITFLFFAGNTVISQSGRGMRAAYTESLTGDIVIQKKGPVTMSLFGANAPHLEDFFLIEPLPAYNEIVELVKAEPGVERWTSQVSTGAHMKLHGEGNSVFLTGVDAANYFETFTGIIIERGRLLKAGEQGVMIHSELAADIEAETEESLVLGENATLTATGAAGFKIRSVPLVGVFRYKTESSAINSNIISDVQTARALLSIRTATSSVKVSEETKKIVDDFDSLYDESGGYAAPELQKGASSLDDIIESYIKDEDESLAVQNNGEVSGGDWNFILIKLKHGANTNKIIADLNKKLEETGAIATGWRTAAGISAILVLALQAFYNAGIILVCIAAGIAAVNILLIALFKRTREIGTLRAIGAGDAYIRILLISENGILGAAGAAAGIVGGAAAMSFINSLGLRIPNKLIVNLLGVSVLHIDFFIEYALGAFVFAMILVMLSLVIPVEMAVRIQPVVAVREG
ncbi:MAG: FtsX-like permease family protein [Spirochaetaceae bacterium]|jgi:ABC-type lipoprotein release transport system permease subunit|nr:FtsX-like permease family protein [Spirochaetaceae bacterium]GMO16869.1 MAG: FtsX-like permease family protein [Termitinemataceae bacterium]